MSTTTNYKISILFDNKCVNDGFLSGYGFSALVFNKFSGNYLLFDTGGKGDVLLHNLKELRVDPSQIKKVIISHNHFDHAGGLSDFYKQNPNIDLYIPNRTKKYERNYPEAKVYSFPSLHEIDDSIYVSGQLGTSIREQALFCKTAEDNFVILVGCTHPGLENFIEKAREQGEVEAVIGGFHGFRKFSYLKGINFIGACHCTAHIAQIGSRFPDQFKKVCVGDTFSF